MKIGNQNEYIELNEVERLPASDQCAGDVRLKISIQLKAFSGSDENVWIEKSDLERFVREFKDLIDEAKGKARLNSMSPDEFWVEIYSTDALGHFEVATQLKIHTYGETKGRYITLSGGFDIELGALDTLFKEFTNFV